MFEDLKRITSKIFKSIIRLMRTRKRYQSHVQQIPQVQRGNVSPGVKPFSIPESEELDNKPERSNAERWYLILKRRGET